VHESILFDVAPLGKAIETLIPDPAKPLAAYDTLYVGIAVTDTERWDEFLVAEKNEKLWAWVNAGGLLLFGETDQIGWNKNSGCPKNAQDAGQCPVDVFPEAYRFEIMYGSG